MSGIDTSIYNQLLKPPKSVAEYDAEAMAGQQNRLALQMGQQKADEYQRGIVDSNKLRSVVSGFGADQGANYNALLSAGRLDEAQKYQKSNAELGKTTADTAHVSAQADETHVKAVNLKFGQVREMFSSIRSPDEAAQLVKGMYADPDLGKLFSMKGDTVDAAISRIPRDPQAFEQWKQAASLTAEKLANYRTPDANAVLSSDTQRRGQNMTSATAAAGRAQDASQFNTREAREKAVPRGLLMQGENGPMLVNPVTGAGTAVTLNGKQIPSKDAAQRVQDAKSVISLLDMAEPLLGTATSSLAGAGYDRVAAAFGNSTEGAQSSAQLKALEGALIAKQPKMSGPQSDKDVLLYRQMAGQVGDSTIPIETRRAAMKTIRELNTRYTESGQAEKPGASKAFNDAEKERRYQEFKAKQGQK